MDVLELKVKNRSFLVTGGAGFIGSAIVRYLVDNGAARVVVLDNLVTGFKSNIANLINNGQVEFIEGDIRSLSVCMKACEGIDYVSHQAALGSVPRSVKDPLTTNQVNIEGFLNMLEAARLNKVKRFVYASSSSVYGSNIDLPKKEDKVGDPLSPYAVTKKVNELYAKVYAQVYQLETIGLRYFNIFGPRQNPKGEYAAVIPLFISNIRAGRTVKIYGDGLQGRDFTYIDNAVNANLLALTCENPLAIGEVFNIACGDRITVNDVYQFILDSTNSTLKPEFVEPRVGEIVDSWADISKSEKILGYKPKILFNEGLKKTIEWFTQQS